MGSRDTSTPLPAEICVTCETRRGWRAWTTWLRILIPVLVGCLLSLGGGWLALRSQAEANAAEVRHLREGRTDDRMETTRLNAAIADGQRMAAEDRAREAEHWREISASLARIEARLDAMERRPGARGVR